MEVKKIQYPTECYRTTKELAGHPFAPLIDQEVIIVQFEAVKIFVLKKKLE